MGEDTDCVFNIDAALLTARTTPSVSNDSNNELKSIIASEAR
jgi:hypothetical protein